MLATKETPAPMPQNITQHGSKTVELTLEESDSMDREYNRGQKLLGRLRESVSLHN